MPHSSDHAPATITAAIGQKKHDPVQNFIQELWKFVRQTAARQMRTADVASVLTDLSAGGTMGLCSQNTIGSAVGKAECGS